MLRTVAQTEKDRSLLAEFMKKHVSISAGASSYENLVVQKPWGYEFLVYDSRDIAIWHLYLKNGSSTSFHAHYGKRTSLFVISGSITFHSYDIEAKIGVGEGMEILPGVFHQSRADWGEDAILIEIETPSNKEDLVRAKDNYGREKLGYEGKNQMIVQGLEKYGYFYMNRYEFYYPIGKTSFFGALHHISNGEKFHEMLQNTNDSWFRFCSCQSGRLRHARLQDIAENLFTANDLGKEMDIIIPQGIDVFELRRGNGNGI